MKLALFQTLIRMFRRELPPKSEGFAEILEVFPFDGPVYVVGDVHGMLDLFRQMETLILTDAEQFETPAIIVLLGDMVDRGPQTAALIDYLLSRQRAGLRMICLRGNHEEMMLQFLTKPDAHMSWLAFGGLETLASYGMDIGGLSEMSGRKLMQLLAAHIPQSHIRFLNDTLPAVQVGQFLLAHAGADQDKPLAAQPMDALLWGSSGQVAPQGLRLVHGHFVVAEPKLAQHCLSIDTGAYMTGRMTCVRLRPVGPPAILTLGKGLSFADIDLQVF